MSFEDHLFEVREQLTKQLKNLLASAYNKGVFDSQVELLLASENNCYDVVHDFVNEAEKAIVGLYVKESGRAK